MQLVLLVDYLKILEKTRGSSQVDIQVLERYHRRLCFRGSNPILKGYTDADMVSGTLCHYLSYALDVALRLKF